MILCLLLYEIRSCQTDQKKDRFKITWLEVLVRIFKTYSRLNHIYLETLNKQSRVDSQSVLGQTVECERNPNGISRHVSPFQSGCDGRGGLRRARGRRSRSGERVNVPRCAISSPSVIIFVGNGRRGEATPWELGQRECVQRVLGSLWGCRSYSFSLH